MMGPMPKIVARGGAALQKPNITLETPTDAIVGFCYPKCLVMSELLTTKKEQRETKL
jgi:hypothetical protein